MSETALPSGKGPRTRLWDSDFNCCLYDSATDDRTVEQFMRDQAELNFTVDHPPDHSWRTRRGGKVARDESGELRWYDSREYLKYMIQAPNPDL
jgi:hypothetical protein